MKNSVIIAAAAVVIVAAAAVYLLLGQATAVQRVESGDNVSVFYTGMLANGTVFNSNVGGQPFNFTVGANQVIQGFNNAVLNMAVNQSKKVTIAVDQAYGPVNPQLFSVVPLSAFGNQTVRPGMQFTEVSKTGQQARGVVTSVTSNTAVLDFNSPLAGQTLIFNITVVGIKK